MRTSLVANRVAYSREMLHHQHNARLLSDEAYRESVESGANGYPGFGAALGAVSRADELLAKIMREVR